MVARKALVRGSVVKGRSTQISDEVSKRSSDEKTTSWLRKLGVTQEIEIAVIEYERQLGGAITAGIATRIFHAIDRCGGLERVRTMTQRDLLRVKNVGPGTVKALIDLGLCRTTSALVSAFKLTAYSDLEVNEATQTFLTSAIEWRQHVELYAGSQITQTMLDDLDELISLLCRK